MNEQQAIKAISTRYAKGKADFQARIASGKMPNCSPGYIGGRCAGGHTFAAVQLCGREFCPDCSKDGSPIHQRRVSRWFPVVNKWDSLGYLVVTIPEGFRRYFMEKNVLRDFRTKLLRKLKEDYKIKAGLCRWHWFGDCDVCGGKGCKMCNDTGAGSMFHPHLNILFEGNYIEDVNRFWGALKKWIVQYLQRLINHELDYCRQDVLNQIEGAGELMDFLLDLKNELRVEKLVLNYSFADSEGKKMNVVKYVTRSTFRIYNSEVKILLHNFRNSVRWGWKKGETDSDELPALCPICKAAGINHVIRWDNLRKFKDNQYIKQDEQTGIYTIRAGPTIKRIGGNNPDHSGFTKIIHESITRKVSRRKFGIKGYWN